MAERYSGLANEVVSAANGISYAYRDTGGSEGALPLVLLQHFRGNLDNWDPALIDARPPRGVSSRSTAPGSVAQLAPPRTPSGR